MGQHASLQRPDCFFAAADEDKHGKGKVAGLAVAALEPFKMFPLPAQSARKPAQQIAKQGGQPLAGQVLLLMSGILMQVVPLRSNPNSHSVDQGKRQQQRGSGGGIWEAGS